MGGRGGGKRVFGVGLKYDLDKSTRHPKLNLTGV